MPSFLGGKSRSAFGQPAFFLAGNRMTIIVASETAGLFCRTQNAESRMMVSGIECETGRYVIYDKLISYLFHTLYR